MKKVILPLLLSGMLISAPGWAQPKLVEKVTRKGDELVIPYEKYVLPNGLTVIIHEDHSDPIVHVDVTYHVGSAREEIGKSGFAHFFEHMMFQGSDNVADEQHFKIITEAGGTLNGTTNRDRTNYFETVPSNQLEKMLWLEADRMGFLVDAVTQQKFEVQRSTVKNERGQNYDNVPYGLVSEVTSKNLYPYGHPYSWLTIGYIEDLNRVNVEDLKNFFLRWYGPNNATLTVGGDVKTSDVLKLADKYFGSIPRGPEVKPAEVPAAKIDARRYISMKDNYAKLPMLRIVYPTVASYNPDEAPLDCLAEILGQGKDSYFYKKLEKKQIAVNASAYQPTAELSGEFVMSVTPFQGKKLSDIEKAVQNVLAEFEKRGVTDDDIEKFRNKREADMIFELESVSGKVSQLANYQTFLGNANYLGKDLERYQKVTKEDVMRVYNKYIKSQNPVVVSVTVKGDENNIAAADNYTVSTTGYVAPNYGYDALKYNKAKDNFDRKQVPPMGANPVVKVPEFWRKDLPSNIKAIGTKTTEVPIVNITLQFKGGQMVEGIDKAGLASFFTTMMQEDTKNYTAEQFSVALDKLGSSIEIYPGIDKIQVSITSLAKNLDKTIALAEEKLLNPKFTEEAFKRNQSKLIENLRNSKARAAFVAGNAFGKIQYGQQSVYGQPSKGSEITVANLKLADVENYYKNFITKSGAKVVVVGDINEKQALAAIDFVQKLPATDITLPDVPKVSTPGKTKVFFIDVPNAAQTEFRIGYVTNNKYDALGNHYKTSIINYPFGGAFNSRLNLDLREDKGWTYGARSYYLADEHTGSYVFAAGIRANATDSALNDVITIMKDYRANGMKPDELKFTQMSIGQSEARKYELSYQKAGFLSNILEYDLPADFSKKQNELLSKLTVSELATVINQYAPDADHINILLVGDKAKVLDGIKKQGYDIVEMNADGDVILPRGLAPAVAPAPGSSTIRSGK
ncbi:MAG: insulinase family protein [Sphingobacteriales bacterium]|nr:MAG: insulinase family protein [Sphingobacteriales bacterium]